MKLDVPNPGHELLPGMSAEARIEGDRIKLTRKDSGVAHEEHHHYIPRGLVADVEGDQVRLSSNADVAANLFEQEESGDPIG